MISTMKVLKKILEILGILLVQVIIGWVVTKFLLKLELDIVEFLTDPGMITFWGAYIIIEWTIVRVRRYREKSKM